MPTPKRPTRSRPVTPVGSTGASAMMRATALSEENGRMREALALVEGDFEHVRIDLEELVRLNRIEGEQRDG